MPEKTDATQDEKRANPQITETDIGVRSLRTITIYPLSMADQIKMTDLITEALNAFYLKEKQEDVASEENQEGIDQENLEFVKLMIDLIKKNLKRLLAMVTDVKKNEDLLLDMTNIQAAKIVTIIYEVNYESVAKNLKSLFEKVSNIFRSERLSQPFVKPTPSTDSKISTEEAGEKEESQSDS